jgi:REP element-mobilizing transposase RayT
MDKKRKTLRLKNYDYSSEGYYFITICTYKFINFFGEVINGAMILNDFGEIADTELLKTMKIRHNVLIEHYVIMPNHIHAIIQITEKVGAYCDTPLQKQFRSPKNNLGSIVRGYKSAVTKQVNILRNNHSHVWQRNYYEHIIRDEKSFLEIVDYIKNNPAKWEYDKYYKLNSIGA